MGYRIGLDIGITSVGWAVIEDNVKGEPIRIIDLGSRIFDVAEQPKTGAPLAEPRRNARGLRRRLRRRKHRIERTQRLLERYNIITRKELKEMYENYRFQYNVYELRVQGLDEKLTNKELARVLISFVKKRGYKSNSKAEENDSKNDSGKLLTATKDNVNLMKSNGYRSVAEMYLKDEKFKFKNKNGEILIGKNGEPLIKIKNSSGDYKNTTLRSLIVDEIKLILNKQKELNTCITDEFIAEYLNIFEGQRNFDEGPGEQSPYSGNLIENMIGDCTFEKGEKRAPKACYTFEYFKLLQMLNHIKIEKLIINEDGSKTKEKRVLTDEEKDKIKELVLNQKDIKFDKIRKELNLDIYERFNMLTYKSTVDYSEEATKEVEKNKKLVEFESYHKIKTVLNKIEKDYIKKLTVNDLDVIGYALTVYKNDNKRKEYLKENCENLADEAIEKILELSFSKFSHLSLKAMKNIIPYSEQGKRYDEAVGEVYNDQTEKVNTEKKTKLRLKDLEQEITNPVVRRGVSQSIKVLNAITNKYNPIYGKPDVVVVELAREMGKDFNERRKIEKSQEDNMKNNETALSHVREFKMNPTGQDIIKYKLWQEQDCKCIYSGKSISIEDLFTEAVDVDHIIPYSACFDDSYNNKVLVLASENRQKGNRVPYKYIKETGRNIDEYEIRVNNLIRNPRKKQKLLKEDYTREDAQSWKKRNLNDTKYISKVMYNLIKNNLEFSDNENFKRKVWTVNGAITAHIRKRLGIRKVRYGDTHHAQDAAVIAITTQGMINKLTKYYQYRAGRYMQNNGEYVDYETGEIIDMETYEKENGIYFPEPWPKFAKELDIRVNCQSKDRMIDCLKAEDFYTYENFDDVKPIFVSRMPKRKVTGAAHMETIRGLKKIDNEMKTISKTELTKLKLKNGEIEGYPDEYKRDDRLLYEALKNRLIEFGGDAQKAFAQDFYKPKADGSRGPIVKKVKIEEKTTLGVELNNEKAFAANGDCVRVDIFYVEDDKRYYFIPIYVSDTIKKELPMKACTRNKKYDDWKIMKNGNFVLSLYPNDLMHIKLNGKIKLNSTSKENKESVELDDAFLYYKGNGITNNTLLGVTSDGKFEQPSISMPSIQILEKYEVDILGNYHKVKLPEKRLPFNINKK